MTADARDMDVVGYVDQWSVAAGNTLNVHVSCTTGRYRADLVRLIHGDDHPDGPGFKARPVPAAFEGEHAGMEQAIVPGSWFLADGLPGLSALTLALWIWPTAPGRGEQCIAAQRDAAGGYRLLVDGEARLVLEIDRAGQHHRLVRPGPLPARAWQFVALAIDPRAAHLHWRPRDFAPGDPGGTASIAFDTASADPLPARLLLAADAMHPQGRSFRADHLFNGKIGAPALFGRALDGADIDAVGAGLPGITGSALARWAFALSAGTDRVPDLSGQGFHGRTFNRPARLVTGPGFTGETNDPAAVPEQYNAAHFHDDDLSDAGWEPSFAISIPDDLPSGIYAARLQAGDTVDHVPFVVRAAPHHSPAPVAILLPTVSYICYSNSDFDPSILPPDGAPLADVTSCAAERGYLRRNRLLSLYGLHSDGSGVSMSSMLRPMPINSRPNSRSMLNGAAHQLAADLSIVDFLEAKGIPHDVITDHDLHAGGAEILARYRTVLSGTHAEYWTGPMLDALAAYQQDGGRFVYLSGNGLYWVTALSDDGTLVEIKRAYGTRSWEAAPGETRLSLTGEEGGLWRHRGRAPQLYVGVGFSAQGFDRGAPYRCTEASHDPRARFIFDGVGDGLIGDFPTLVSAYGAAGYEVDRADVALGTPRHALVVAQSEGLNDNYQNAIEEALGMMPGYGGTTCPNVRADMVFYETPKDGAVFSVGSISWCSALAYNGYDNGVARITENVVRAFATPGPLPVG